MECSNIDKPPIGSRHIFALFIYRQVVLYFLFDSSKFSISLCSSDREVSSYFSCVAPVCNFLDKVSKLIFAKIEGDYKQLASFSFDRETGGKLSRIRGQLQTFEFIFFYQKIPLGKLFSKTIFKSSSVWMLLSFGRSLIALLTKQ